MGLTVVMVSPLPQNNNSSAFLNVVWKGFDPCPLPFENLIANFRRIRGHLLGLYKFCSFFTRVFFQIPILQYFLTLFKRPGETRAGQLNFLQSIIVSIRIDEYRFQNLFRCIPKLSLIMIRDQYSNDYLSCGHCDIKHSTLATFLTI